MDTDAVSAAGDIATGAVIARAVEPSPGEARSVGHGACLNCGAALMGSHCHACGQSAHIHRTLGAYGHDLLHGVFHFEGKIWRTLPLLVLKPGELTRRYIHGERATFVSPLALFLFAVFLMFAIVGGLAGEMHAPQLDPAMRNKTLPQVEAQLAKIDARLQANKAAIATARDRRADTSALEAERDKIGDDRSVLREARSFLKGEKPTVLGGVKTGWSQLDAAVMKAGENPNLLLYKLQSSAYKYSWALIPLSTPLVWLLFFWRRQFKMYDHAVFVTYSLTFMLFLVVVLTLIGFAGAPEPVVPIAGTFIPPLHIYRQLRGAYGVSRAGGVLRTILICVFGGVVLMLFLALLLALGIMH